MWGGCGNGLSLVPAPSNPAVVAGNELPDRCDGSPVACSCVRCGASFRGGGPGDEVVERGPSLRHLLLRLIAVRVPLLRQDTALCSDGDRLSSSRKDGGVEGSVGFFSLFFFLFCFEDRGHGLSCEVHIAVCGALCKSININGSSSAEFGTR